MSRVDFYILEEQGGKEPRQFACELTSKAWRSGHRVHLYTGSAAQAQELDDLLWTFRDISFVPHALAGGEDVDCVPVTIGWIQGPAPTADVLINLTGEVQPCMADFARIAEIVGPNEQDRARARDRYRQYREQGHELQNHFIGSTAA